MQVYAVTYTVGFYAGHKELIGIYSTAEKAIQAKQADMQRNNHNPLGYAIKSIEIDKTVNEVYQEW